MAFPRPYYLTPEQLSDVFASFKPNQTVSVVRFVYKASQTIRRPEQMTVESLKTMVFSSMDDERLPGGDFEVEIPALGKKLYGHHDGVFWLEPRA